MRASDRMTIAAQGYIVPDEILQNALYVEWSNKTLAQVLAAKTDLQNAIKAIIPSQDNIAITQYLYNILVISTALG
jgi:hypothetical protein